MQVTPVRVTLSVRIGSDVGEDAVVDTRRAEQVGHERLHDDDVLAERRRRHSVVGQDDDVDAAQLAALLQAVEQGLQLQVDPGDLLAHLSSEPEK